MNLYFEGHDCRYAVEQMMMSLFPGARPVYPGVPPRPGEDDCAVVTFRDEGELVTAVSTVTRGGKTAEGTERAQIPAGADARERERVKQHILRLSFYRAATRLLGFEPPWGSLTGVRPVKLPTRALWSGQSEEEALSQLRGFYRVSESRARLAMDCAKAALKVKQSLREDEISLYLGIPFCPTRCAYCSFISADVGRSLRQVEPYLAALCREVAAAGEALQKAGKYVRTVYIGGGTPTTLSAEQLAVLLGAIRDRIDLSRCTEFTVEAGRPDTITPEKLAAIRTGGGDRVSVNPQTMEDDVLKAMGRAHTASDIRRAMAMVRESGIPCVNMDLIAGLPADSAAGFRRSLDEVLSLSPENVTVHTLALKRGARLMEEQRRLPGAAEVTAMLDYAEHALRQSGYVPYYLYRQKYMSGSFENVGWCKPGKENAYNICMMEELHSILSLGAGGISKVIDWEKGAIERSNNPKYPTEYLEHIDDICAAKAAWASALP